MQFSRCLLFIYRTVELIPGGIWWALILIFGSAPTAQVFMGSLGTIWAAELCSYSASGGTVIAEASRLDTVSVMMQVASMDLRQTDCSVAPIHHHFELKDGLTGL